MGRPGIVADHHGNAYVADAWNHRVQKFAPDGAFITSWTAWGDGDGHFISACSGGNRYEGAYDGFSSEGTYEVAFHAMDSDGNLSFPARTTVTVASPTCPQCTADPVILKDITFDSATKCVCIAMTAITLGSGVRIESGAAVTFKAPKVTLQSGMHVEKGAVVKIVQE